MHSKRMIFWNQETQKMRFSASNDFEGIQHYSFIGFANHHEFEIIIEVLFEKYGDEDMTTGQVLSVYQEFMHFLEMIKNHFI